MAEARDDLEERALAPLQRSGRGYRLLVLGLLVVVGIGLYAYSTQLRRGLAVTGMAPTVNKIMWGVYIANFVFFIGISHAGTLISAILRVCRAGWRAPVTRMAEFITVVALSVGGLFPIIDMGRPDRVLNLALFGRWQSPILWDLFAITTYLTGSLLYLYLPLIPDLAVCRDRLGDAVSRPKRWFYRTLSVGWTGAPDQRRNLVAAIGTMMIVIILIAVSVHTVVSWIFGMTLRTGWNTALFGIYFVTGAIFSGIATLILVMVILRRIYHLEAYITERHFLYLGYILAAVGLLMVYFNISEVLTAGYKMEAGEPIYLREILTGSFAPLYWFYVVGGLLPPTLILLSRRTRTIGGVVVASILVDVALWVERYVIVVASLRVPQMPYANLARYVPSWQEIAISLGSLALFVLIIAIFVRWVPVISIWEVREHRETERRPVLEPGLAGATGVEPVVGS